MDNFSTAKHGYDKIEVEKFISDLKQKSFEKDEKIVNLESQLEKYKNMEGQINEKNDNISIALTAAVEKAKQIEKSSQNVYKLKIQQINILYNKWQTMLSEMIAKHPDLEEVEDVKKIISEFKLAIKSTIDEDSYLTVSSPITNDNDSIRNLLSKMNSFMKKAPKEQKECVHERKSLTKDLQTKQSELRRIEEKAPLIKPIYTPDEGKEEDNLLDKFLADDDDAKAQKNSFITLSGKEEKTDSGFNLEEAVNPKEDLEEIMKAFSFYNDKK